MDAVSTVEHEALVRLLEHGQRDTHQGGRVRSFLLAWWNAEDWGGFDLTAAWGLDDAIAQDVVTVFAMIVRERGLYPDKLGYSPIFEQIVDAMPRPSALREPPTVDMD